MTKTVREREKENERQRQKYEFEQEIYLQWDDDEKGLVKIKY